MRVNVLSSIQSRFSNRSYSRWSNPDARDTVDELDWERTAATDGGRFPLTDHTTGTEGGFFMQVLDSVVVVVVVASLSLITPPALREASSCRS